MFSKYLYPKLGKRKDLEVLLGFTLTKYVYRDY